MRDVSLGIITKMNNLIFVNYIQQLAISSKVTIQKSREDIFQNFVVSIFEKKIYTRNIKQIYTTLKYMRKNLRKNRKKNCRKNRRKNCRKNLRKIVEKILEKIVEKIVEKINRKNLRKNIRKNIRKNRRKNRGKIVEKS